jgi:dipeptidyl aminopeptidase/acylaminoacyl peptidase
MHLELVQCAHSLQVLTQVLYCIYKNIAYIDTTTSNYNRSIQFNAALIRPPGFDEKKKYPVIAYVYGGPHFNSIKADLTCFYFHQWLANHGFVVVALDGISRVEQ